QAVEPLEPEVWRPAPASDRRAESDTMMLSRQLNDRGGVPARHTLSSRNSFMADVQQEYDAFKAKGLKLNLTRGKPSSAQLDLSAALLSLPGPTDFTAQGATDCRNYGGLQGLAEAR